MENQNIPLDLLKRLAELEEKNKILEAQLRNLGEQHDPSGNASSSNDEKKTFTENAAIQKDQATVSAVEEQKSKKSQPQQNKTGLISTNNDLGNIQNAGTQNSGNQYDYSKLFGCYKKREGTVDRGKEYEYLMCTYYALKLCTNEKVIDFEMKTNDKTCGDFDDVSLTVTFIDEPPHTFLLQLKHTQEKRGVTSKMLADAKNFNIPKYLKSFHELTNRTNITCILATNREMQMAIDSKVTLNCGEVTVKPYQPKSINHLLLNTAEKEGTCCVQFELDSNQQHSADVEEFFQNFCLFTNQNNYRTMELLIEQMLIDLFGCKIDFISFMEQWWKGSFVLTKHDTIIKLAEMALSPYIHEIPFKTNSTSEKSNCLKTAIENFDLTLIKDCDKNIVGQLWAETSIETNTLSKASLKYGLSTKGIGDRSELPPADQTKAFWYLHKIPLIIKYEDDAKDRIHGAVKLLATEKNRMKLIILGHKSREEFPKCEIFENLYDLSRYEQSYFDIIENFSVSLQGRPNISLKELVNSDTETAKLIETKDLFQMLTNLCIGKTEAVLPEAYIPRTISPLFLDTRRVLAYYISSKNNLFILNCDQNFKEILASKKFFKTGSSQFRNRTKQEESDDQIEVKELYDYLQSSTVSGTNKKPIIVSTNEKHCTLEKFNEVCKVNSQFNVYLLQIIDQDRCMLVCNRGNLSKLNSMTYEESSVKEEDIYTIFKRPLNVITGKPGIGKSTLLTYLSHMCPSDYWCIRINLIGCSKFFKQEFSNEQILDKILKNDDNFLEQIVTKFKNQKKMYLFLDGLDEIESEYIGSILEFIKYTYSIGINVWISSRESLKEKLAHWSLFVIQIQELTEDEQKEYIHKRLTDDSEDTIKYSEDETAKITEEIFKSVSINHNARRLLGIPLQLYIITEIFRNRRQKYEFTEDIFVLSKMYREFFNGKHRHQHAKAGTVFLQALDKPVLKQYEMPALRSCLHTETFNKLVLKKKKLDESQKFLAEIKDQGNKLGIISLVVEENQTLQAIFTHQSFAEYFACVWLERNEEKLQLIKEDFFNDKYQNLRLIFDIMAAEEESLHLAALYKNPEQVRSYISDCGKKDKKGRSALHLACSYCEKVYLNTRNEEETAVVLILLRILLQCSDPTQNDELFDWNSVIYALQSRSLLPVEAILEKQTVNVEDLSPYFTQIDLLRYSSRFGYPCLLKTVIQSYPNVISQINGSILRNAVRRSTESNNLDLKQKYIETVEILARNCDVNESEHDGSTALHLACEYGAADSTLVKILVDSGADTNVATNKNKRKETPLHLAAIHNNCETIILLLENNAKVNEPNSNDWTPLHYACKYGNLDVIKKLLEYGADINARTNEQATVLHLATSSNDPEIIKFLLANGRSVEELDYDDWTPLHYACSFGTYDVIQMLLELGATINNVSKKDATALHMAGMGRNVDVLKFLIDNGGDVNQRNKMNWTPLHYASRWGNCDLINKLLELGADIDAVTSKKMTMLHLASLGTNTDVIKLFIDKDRDVNAADLINATPLHYACREGNYDVVKLLLEHNASVKTVTALYTTVLHAAAINNNTKIVELLLGKEANVNAAAVNNVTPLHMACLMGNYDVTRVLLQHGAGINAVTSQGGIGDTRLMSYIENFVLDVGIPVNELIETNRTPLYFACKKKNYDVAEMLLKEGARLDPNSCDSLIEDFDKVLYNGNVRTVELILEQLTDIEKVGAALARLPAGFPTYLVTRNGGVDSILLREMSRRIEEIRRFYGTSKVPDYKLFEYLIEKFKDLNLEECIEPSRNN